MLIDRLSQDAAAPVSGPESWLIFNGGKHCGLYQGNLESREYFQRLALSGDSVLAHLSRIPARLGSRTDRSTYSDEQGWIFSVFKTAVAMNTPRLWVREDPAFYDRVNRLKRPVTELSDEFSDELDEGRNDASLIHPVCSRLAPDVFSASYEAIRIWLDPSSAISLTTEYDPALEEWSDTAGSYVEPCRS